jgi:hypothetical protein
LGGRRGRHPFPFCSIRLPRAPVRTFALKTISTWATIAYGSALYVWADARVVGYDLVARAPTTDRDAGVSAIGAGSLPACTGL